MSSRAQVAVQKRYARWPIASPSAKYSKSASSITSAVASATIAVEPHKASPTTNGINTTAVATRFQVIEMDSPEKLQASSHHIERNKSRTRSRTDKVLLSSPFEMLRRHHSGVYHGTRMVAETRQAVYAEPLQTGTK